MSLEKIKYWKRRNPNNLDHLDTAIKGRMQTEQSNYLCKQTIPRYRAYSESKLSRSSLVDRQKKRQSPSNLKLYKKLNHQLQEIKQTLKKSLVSTNVPRKKKPSRHRQKVITEISEPEPKRYKYTRNYYDVLDHIAEIKSKNKTNKTADGKQLRASQIGEQKTLFYGIDYIDQSEFKIKIKLTKTQYLLFAKNNHTKAMIEMSYTDYMRLHLGQLKGNPCNIFRHLLIKGQYLELSIYGRKSDPPSMKSYVSSN